MAKIPLTVPNAANIPYDDSTTNLGVSNLQDALVAIFALLGTGGDGSGPTLDLSVSTNTCEGLLVGFI